MPYITSTGIADLPYCLRQSDIKPFIQEMFADVFSDLDRLLTVFENTDIETRHFCVPIEWFRTSPNFKEKNNLYIEQAVKLGKAALANSLENAGVDPLDISHLFFVSTSGLSTPSIDARILNELGPFSTIKRTPIWGLGCAGGAAGIARALDYLKAYPTEVVALIAVELCGLTFQPNDLTKSNLVATSLFADGAAAVILSGDEAKIKGPLKFIQSRSVLWDNTLDIMGWDISSSGFHVVFSKDIPSFVRSEVSPIIQRFLSDADVRTLDHYIFHPGGKKVIEAYESGLQIPPEKMDLARKILREHGNMSSCTVLYVLHQFLQENKILEGDIGLITALGPGFGTEMTLVEGVLS